MSKAYDSIKRGLNDAIAHASGKKIGRIHKPDPESIKALRERIGMTQEQFATTFGISVGTLRHWERGARRPQGPAAVLLHVIATDHKAVLRALA
jgi:putative transcriptional regulator